MKTIKLQVTATGGAGVSAGASEKVAGYAGMVVAVWAVLEGAAAGCDMTVREHIDGETRTVCTFTDINTTGVYHPTEDLHDKDSGAAIADQYAGFVTLFGGMVDMVVAGSNDVIHTLRLLVVDQ